MKARVALFFFLLITAATYPLIDVIHPVLPDNDDAYFSVWRLSWISRQMAGDPVHLFDANIFFPQQGTLAYSDAMLAIGAAAAPFIWIGLHPVTVHNLLMIAAIFTSALAAWGLCRELTGSATAALIGGVIFSLAPYRFGHIGHLELQWTAFMPMVLLLLHRSSAAASARWWPSCMLAGVLLALQGLASLYYLAFFGIFLAAWAALLLPTYSREHRARLLRLLMATGLTAVLLLAPYLAAYASMRRTVGARSSAEIQQFSAVAADYLRVSLESESYVPRPQEAAEERSLFPGATAGALALVGIVLGRTRTSAVYAALVVLTVDLSFGSNGLLYPLLLEVAPVLSSFRAPARFAVLVLLSLAVLASAGLNEILKRSHARLRSSIVTTSVLLAVIEYWCAPIATRRAPLAPSNVYRWLATHPRTVILELPIPTADTLWLYETTHQYMSIFHWQQLVNGYSGFAPEPYLETLETIRRGDPGRIARRLQYLGVEYVVIHENLFGPDRFADALRFFSTLPAAGPPLSFGDALDPAVVVPILK